MGYCSYWFEGDWAQCCMIHDSSLLDFKAHLDLGMCVAQQGGLGHLFMGFIMFVGVVCFNDAYQYMKKQKEHK